LHGSQPASLAADDPVAVGGAGAAGIKALAQNSPAVITKTTPLLILY